MIRWTKEQTDKEVEYITGITNSRDFHSFNNDVECFRRYASMQMSGMYNEGFRDEAMATLVEMRKLYDNA